MPLAGQLEVAEVVRSSCSSCSKKTGDRHVCSEEQELLGGHARSVNEISFRATSASRFEGTFKTTITCNSADCSSLGAPSLPCSIEGITVGLEALTDDFAPELGTYDTSVGTPLITSCGSAPDVDARQQLRVEVSQDDPTEAQVFSGDDPNPFNCTFEGAGKTTCTRILADLEREQIAKVSVAWTGGSSFEGTASLEITPFAVRAEPCLALYHLDGALAN